MDMHSTALGRAGHFESQNFENGIVLKYATFDIEPESDIYFDFRTVLTRGVLRENPIFPKLSHVAPKSAISQNYNS